MISGELLSPCNSLSSGNQKVAPHSSLTPSPRGTPPHPTALLLKGSYLLETHQVLYQQHPGSSGKMQALRALNLNEMGEEG